MVITANSTAASCEELLARLSRPGRCVCAIVTRCEAAGQVPAHVRAQSRRRAPSCFPDVRLADRELCPWSSRRFRCAHSEPGRPWPPPAQRAAGRSRAHPRRWPCRHGTPSAWTRLAARAVPRRHSLPSGSQEGGCPGPTLPRRPLLRGPPPAVRNRRGAAVWAAVREEQAAATDSSGRQGASGERRQDRFWCNYPAIFPKPWEGGAGVPPPITATDHFPFGFTVWVSPLPPRGSGESGSLLPDAGGAASCRTSRGRAARRSTSPGRRAPTLGSPRCS